VAHSQETKRKTRSEFVKGMPLKAAAALHNVPYGTARAWKESAKKEGDDWDISRAALRLSDSGVRALTAEVIEDFVLLFKSTIDALKEDTKLTPLQKADVLAKLSDAYQKTIKAAGNSNPSLSKLAIGLDVLKRQLDFIRDKFPHHASAFMEILEPFGEHLSHELN
jgi:hypothetical protein